MVAGSARTLRWYAETMYRVLFVCMGNICRSPLAEGIFAHKLSERGLTGLISTDSCGTYGGHAGEAPHPLSQSVAKLNGIDISAQRARPLTLDDLRQFDRIIAMDSSNLRHIRQMDPANAAKSQLLLAYFPACGFSDVPDPYYGGTEGFHEVFRLIDQATDHLLHDIAQTLSLR